MALSVKNGWLDKQNHVYIFFTLEDVMEMMNCRNDKSVKMLAELDAKKGVGLIERVKQGQGKPTIIYVRKFIDHPEVLTSDKPKSELPDMPKYGLRKNRGQDFGESECNNTKGNYTELNDTENEPDQSYLSPAPLAQSGMDRSDRMDMMDGYLSLVKSNIEYDTIATPFNRRHLDEIVEIMTETICSTRSTIRIAGEDYPKEVVNSKFLKLNSQHTEYVLECLNATTSEIRNIRQYLLTVLFNASNTMESYYSVMVNRDMLEHDS